MANLTRGQYIDALSTATGIIAKALKTKETFNAAVVLMQAGLPASAETIKLFDQLYRTYAPQPTLAEALRVRALEELMWEHYESLCASARDNAHTKPVGVVTNSESFETH